MTCAIGSDPVFPTLKQVGGGGTASGQDGMEVSGEAQQEGAGGAAFDKLKAVYVACKAREDALYYLRQCT